MHKIVVAAFEDPPPIPEAIGKFFVRFISTANFCFHIFFQRFIALIIIFELFDNFEENGPFILKLKDSANLTSITSP